MLTLSDTVTKLSVLLVGDLLRIKNVKARFVRICQSVRQVRLKGDIKEELQTEQTSTTNEVFLNFYQTFVDKKFLSCSVNPL